MIKLRHLNDLIEKPISGEWGTESAGGGTFVLRTTNFTNIGKLQLDDVVKRTIPRKKIISKKLLKGDIIIEKSGGSPKQPVGRVVFFNEDGLYLCNNFTSILRPKKEIVFPKYLLYQLFCNHCLGLTCGYQNKTTGIINLQLARYVKKLKIPLPPLPIQQKIATILDTADALKQKDKALIAKYDELCQSLFLDMFGDPFNNQKGFNKGTIRDLVTEVKYGTSAKAVDGGEYPYLRMGNITYQGYMDFNDLKHIDLSDKDKPKYLVKKGDLLFNRTNSKELVGKTGLYTDDTDMAIAGYLIRVRVNQKASPYFIWGYLNSKHGKLILNNMCKNIVGMANINAQELQDIKILFPPIDLQKQFAERIQAIEQQKQQAKASQQKSEDLFNCLLQKAFKGELV